MSDPTQTSPPPPHRWHTPTGRATTSGSGPPGATPASTPSHCVGYTIPGERNYLVGSIYIAQYLFYPALYGPSLIVISLPTTHRPRLLQADAVNRRVGQLRRLLRHLHGRCALLSWGRSHRDNTMLLIVVGHLVHCAVHLLHDRGAAGFNRYIELKSRSLADRFFSGRRLSPVDGHPRHLRCQAPLHLPGPATHLQHRLVGVLLFQIDMREEAELCE